ncbi:hypothetical protein, partial [Pseudomonas sp.]|uniref:hypothetical protein n=1 Tax=Pseudomonas sp. TaxID=306 RepID=UPI003FD7FEBD
PPFHGGNRGSSPLGDATIARSTGPRVIQLLNGPFVFVLRFTPPAVFSVNPFLRCIAFVLPTGGMTICLPINIMEIILYP